jgi:putative oxidoreductase
MFISADDFRIKAESFDLTKSPNVLRIICGAFFIPHVLGKFAGGGFNPPIIKFFGAAGFHPPELWISLAAAGELATAIALVLGICTRFAALSSAALLGFAVYALQVVKGFGWTWNTGGYEYPVFWLIASLCVALDAWRKHLAARQPAPRAAPALAS